MLVRVIQNSKNKVVPKKQFDCTHVAVSAGESVVVPFWPLVLPAGGL